MNQHEKLQLIEDVCLGIICNLRAYRTGKLDEDNALKLIGQEIQKLECVDLNKREVNDYLLTEPDFGPNAYLRKNSEQSWVVVVDNVEITKTYTEPLPALDEYIEQYVDYDFIRDFVIGKDLGRCNYGPNDCAVYIQKRFEAYVIGKDL